jgi:hypothetical protein
LPSHSTNSGSRVEYIFFDDRGGALGRQVAALLDPETPVNGVTAGKVRAELKVIGVPARVGGGSLNPSSELNVTARWGVAGKGGVCMPGKGKAIDRAYTPDDQSANKMGERGYQPPDPCVNQGADAPRSPKN